MPQTRSKFEVAFGFVAVRKPSRSSVEVPPGSGSRRRGRAKMRGHVLVRTCTGSRVRSTGAHVLGRTSTGVVRGFRILATLYEYVLPILVVEYRYFLLVCLPVVAAIIPATGIRVERDAMQFHLRQQNARTQGCALSCHSGAARPGRPGTCRLARAPRWQKHRVCH